MRRRSSLGFNRRTTITQGVEWMRTRNERRTTEDLVQFMTMTETDMIIRITIRPGVTLTAVERQLITTSVRTSGGAAATDGALEAREVVVATVT